MKNRRPRRGLCFVLALSIIGVYSVRAAADDEQSGEPPARPFTVRLKDEAGKPVEGAEVGVCACVGPYVRELAAKDKTQWYYNQHARSNAEGLAHLKDAGELQRLGLIARHEQRKLMAVARLDPDKTAEPVELTLVGETQIAADVLCKELAERGHALDFVNLYVRVGGKSIFECGFEEPRIRLSLPPGEYELEAYGSLTHFTNKTVRIQGGSPSQTLEPIELQPTNLALLRGRPAPEVPGVVAWKNTAPFKLADLRGQCVLLEFWGYWCGPCVSRMPELFALHDKYRERGLRVIGVHVDLGADEDEKVDTADKLDSRLVETRKVLWEGRDLPFPVALVEGQRTPYRDGIADEARSAAAAAYGVTSYPTQVLIDRHGNVVGKFYHDEKGIAQLEKALDEK